MSAQTAELVLQVEGMSCLSCVAHVEGALGDLDGVVQADVDLRRGTVRVGYLPAQVSAAEMQRALRTLGYQSRLAS